MRIELAPRIVVDPEIRFGKPIIEGTRAPVETVVGELGAGMTIDEVIDEYGVSREDVLAAVGYAARIVSKKRIKAQSTDRDS